MVAVVNKECRMRQYKYRRAIVYTHVITTDTTYYTIIKYRVMYIIGWRVVVVICYNRAQILMQASSFAVVCGPRIASVAGSTTVVVSSTDNSSTDSSTDSSSTTSDSSVDMEYGAAVHGVCLKKSICS